MRGIHCYFSKPILLGRHSSGVYTSKCEKILPDYALYTMILSALQWKKTNGTIKLYCDKPVLQLLEQYEVTSCWDEIDLSLENIPDNDINPKVFWSAAKFYSYLQEKEPFVCIDTDVIVWRKLDIDENADWQFAHWEKIEDNDVYPSFEKLSKPADYDFPLPKDTLDRAANMCITVFNNMDFCKLFTNAAFEFMQKNKISAIANKYAMPEILYMEQRLPLLLSEKYSYSFKSFCDYIWSPKSFRFLNSNNEPVNWDFPSLDNSSLFSHIWLYKNTLEQDIIAKYEFEEKILSYILQEFHIDIYEKKLNFEVYKSKKN